MSEPETFSTTESNAIRHFTAVGMVATAWASVELILDGCALELAGYSDDITLQCFTAQVIGSARKVDAYISIAMLKGAERFAGELDAFGKDTARLAEQRNRIVHDPWNATHPDGPRRLEVSARRKLKSGYVEVSTADVTAFHDKLKAHVDRLMEIHIRIMAHIESLSGKSP